jgi:hypothetical protein
MYIKKERKKEREAYLIDPSCARILMGSSQLALQPASAISTVCVLLKVQQYPSLSSFGVPAAAPLMAVVL